MKIKFNKIVLYSFLVSVFGAEAFAQSARNDWNTLRNSKKISISQPDFVKYFGPEGIFNICIDDDEFKSINPVPVCISYKDVVIGVPNSEFGFYKDKKCNEVVVKDVTLSRNRSKEVCKEYAPSTEESANGCLEWQTITETLPQYYRLEVLNAQGELKGNRMFFKSYMIPECD